MTGHITGRTFFFRGGPYIETENKHKIHTSKQIIEYPKIKGYKSYAIKEAI